jgi:hypothetical protein
MEILLDVVHGTNWVQSLQWHVWVHAIEDIFCANGYTTCKF